MNADADILLIANNFPPVRGGSGSVYASLARCAAARITVLAPRIGYTDGLPLIGWREYDRTAPFRVVRLPLLRTTLGRRRGAMTKALFTLQDILIRGHVVWAVLRLLLRHRQRAVCIGELLASGWLLDLLGHVPGLRRLVYVHGEEITTDDPYDPGFVRRRRALLAADRIIVVSRFTRHAVLGLLGEAEAGRIVLIENGVDTGRFHPGPRSPELAGRYGLAGRFVFVTVCRLLEKKGVDQALRAFARLLPEHPDSRYLIVGSGPYEPFLRELVAELGLGEAVVFAGNVPDQELVEHYRLGDVFVMPNRALPNGDTEGFGLVFLEANACGLPVIAGRDGGSADAARDDENGLVVDGNSVGEIHAAMRRLREDAALRTRLGRLGLAAAKAADWTSRAEAFLQVCVAE
jgi:phosphatidylinositol alpha-1,6-mannosyltransferase